MELPDGDDDEPDEDGGVSAKRHRPGRPDLGPRKATVQAKRLTREVMRAEAAKLLPIDWARLEERPRTRGECRDRARPCPFVGCRHHLFLDVNPDTGSIIFNFPDRDFDQLDDTCALDVAERGGLTLDEVGRHMNLTRERIRQVEVRALIALKRSPASNELAA